MLWNLLACVFWYVSPSLSRTLSLHESVLWWQLGRAKTEAGQWAQKPSSTPPLPWETPRECRLSGRIGQKKESRRRRRGGGGGKRGGKSKEGWREESIGRITQAQWNIPNYVSAGQIPPCGHIVMREWDIWGNEGASLCLAQCLRSHYSPVSVLCFVCFGTTIVV